MVIMICMYDLVFLTYVIVFMYYEVFIFAIIFLDGILSVSDCFYYINQLLANRDSNS